MKHRVEKIFEDEIRFGPAYYRLKIDDKMVPDRIFGEPLKWSDDSRLLAAQEWLTTDYQKGPVTRAVLIDVEAWSIAPLKVAEKGFAEEFRFEGLRFVYRKKFLGSGEETETEVHVPSINNWSSLAPNKRVQATRETRSPDA